jgi:hypothetical protein
MLVFDPQTTINQRYRDFEKPVENKNEKELRNL